MTENIRFVAGSLGYRWGGAHRFGVDLEVASYDLQWQRIAYDIYVDDTGTTGEVAPTLGDARVTYFRRWDVGVGLRFVYELAVF